MLADLRQQRKLRCGQRRQRRRWIESTIAGWVAVAGARQDGVNDRG